MKKSFLFPGKSSINTGGQLMALDRARVMGILNLSADSFYDGGRYPNEERYLARFRQMTEEGADIIDIGAQSTRPGAKEIGADEELKILIPAIRAIRKEFPRAVISVDTTHAKVAEQCILDGANMINDISGGTFDLDMFHTIAHYNVPYVLMHTGGRPETMQHNPQYDNVVKEIVHFLSRQLDRLNQLGVNDVIIDPGFGFGKTLEHNYELLRHLEHFQFLEAPVLIGISRKSMIYKPLNINPDNALTGTAALQLYALQKGATFLRVHDVQAAREVIKLHELIEAV
jgi:dihydropteroate synthase